MLYGHRHDSLLYFMPIVMSPYTMGSVWNVDRDLFRLSGTGEKTNKAHIFNKAFICYILLMIDAKVLNNRMNVNNCEQIISRMLVIVNRKYHEC